MECYHKILPLGNASSLVERFELFPRMIQVPLPFFAQLTFFQAKLGEISYRIIEGIFAPSPTFAHPLPLFAHPLPLFAHPLPFLLTLSHFLLILSQKSAHFTLNTYTIQAQPLLKLRITSLTYAGEKSYP